MNRIKNAWELGKSSWAVLNRDRELIAIPIIGAVAALVVFGVVAGPATLLLGGSSDSTGTSDFAMWLFMVLAVVGASWMTTIAQAAVMAGAAERMDGGDPTIGSAFSVASKRAASLLGWAALATVVSLVLEFIEERLGLLGRVISWIGGIAFSVLSFLALPIIIFEQVGAIEAFKRSSRLLKSTWGEQLSFNFGFAILSIIAMVPAVLLAVALAGTGVTPLAVLGVVVAVVWIAAVAAITSALSAVFKAALYRWTQDLPVDPAFGQDALSGAFVHRRR